MIQSQRSQVFLQTNKQTNQYFDSGGSRPLNKRGGGGGGGGGGGESGLQTKFFPPFGPQFGLTIRRVGGPPGPLP